MSFGEKLKALRKEKGWSQEDLARKVGGDGRQISRYENGHIMPSAEVLAKIAETFDVSLDYLLFDNVHRRPLHLQDYGILEKIAELQSLSEKDRDSLHHIINAMVIKNQFRDLAEKAH